MTISRQIFSTKVIKIRLKFKQVKVQLSIIRKNKILISKMTSRVANPQSIHIVSSSKYYEIQYSNHI